LNTALAFAIVYYSIKNKFLLFSNFQEKFFLYFFLFSALISLSRTTYILFLVVLLIPIIKKTTIFNKIYWSYIFIILFIIFGGLFVQLKTESVSSVTFTDKFKGSLDEMVIKDYTSMAEINQHWRGYEGFLGLSKYYDGNEFELFFGQGFGTVVYTDYSLFQGKKLSVIPIFHNGYITILLKTGIIGLLFFFVFLYRLLKQGKFYLKFGEFEHQFSGKLLIFITFAILIRTLVTHGIYTTSADLSLLILLGANLKFNISK
jgi:hypothetical protein